MKRLLIVLMGIIFIFGCARIRVEAPKESIKVDISMRLDIYEHIAKDIDDIEGIVSGSGEKAKPKDNRSFLGYFTKDAFAQEGLSPEVEEAALRRRDRHSELSLLQGKGVIGENKSGLIEIRDASAADSSVEQLVKAENDDRMIIYQAVAKKNNTSVEEVKNLYAKRLQQDAPTGTPIEVVDEATGAAKWKIK